MHFCKINEVKQYCKRQSWSTLLPVHGFFKYRMQNYQKETMINKIIQRTMMSFSHA